MSKSFDALLQRRIDTVRSSIPISYIYPGVKDSGTSDCPICGGKNKFYVKSGWGRCFRPSCDLSLSSNNKALDIIGLFRYKNNLHEKGSFFKALDMLEKDHCIFTVDSPKGVEDTNINEEVSSIYHSELNSRYGKTARDYLEGRGIDPYLIDTLSIGYSRHDSILQDYGLSSKDLEERGLFNGKKEVFSNRVVFPVRDISGYVKCFTGRYIGSIPTDSNGEDMFPRWKHSLSNKEDSITNYMGLEENIPTYQNDYIVITEGYMDALSLYQIGIPSVCIFGLYGLTKHISKLRKFNTIVCAFDIDTFPKDHPTFPGEYKSWRVVIPQLIDLQILLPSSDIKLLFVPGEGTNSNGSYTCKDVNEWLTNSNASKSDVSLLIDNSSSLVDYLLQTQGPHIQHHESLLRLLISTNRDYSCLEKFIPQSFSTLDYAVAILTR